MGHPHDDWGLESVDPSQTSSTNTSFKRVINQVNKNAKCRFCLWTLALVCAANIMFMLIGYDKLVNMVAVGHMVLSEGGGEKYQAWKSSPMPVYYKVTVFNLTNPGPFMSGARPTLRECGPYVYRMVEEKIDVEFHENDTVTYRTKPMYVYEPSLSGGLEEDTIWTVNIPLVNAADAVKSSSFLKTVIQVAQKIHGFKTLRSLKVKELLWGYQSHVMDWARTIKDVPYPHPQFGLLVGFNNTAQEPYTMYTGGSDPDFMNTIYSWNGKTALNFWSGDACNEIKGTDASGFHPGVSPSDKLYIFNGQLCRALPLVYQKVVVHSGVETYRFVPPKDTFAYGPKYPKNDCFCGPEGCPLRGLLDMKPCYYGASVAFSFPHFYQADPKLRHVVRGLRPDPELHGTQFDIYPKLGVPLRVKLRMQMNIVIDGNQALQRDRHFDIVFPVFWFEAGIDSLPLEMVSKLKMAQDLPPVVKTTSLTVCAALSFLFLVLLLASSVSGWCGIEEKHSRTSTPDHLPDTPWPPAKHTQKPNVSGVGVGATSIFDSSGYARGSLSSLTPGETGGGNASFSNGVYPSKIFDDLDGGRTGGIVNSLDRPPPAYSSQMNTKASSSSFLSVEVHNSASLLSLNSPLHPPPEDVSSDEFKRPGSSSSSSGAEDKKGDDMVILLDSPIMTNSREDSPIMTKESLVNSSEDSPPSAPAEVEGEDEEEEPLATSSPQESPNTSAEAATSCPTSAVLSYPNSVEVASSCPASVETAPSCPTSVETAPSCPTSVERFTSCHREEYPDRSRRPPPLESEL